MTLNKIVQIVKYFQKRPFLTNSECMALYLPNEISLDALENFWVGYLVMSDIFYGEYLEGPGYFSFAWVRRHLSFLGTENIADLIVEPVIDGTLFYETYEPGPVPSLR